MASSKNKKLKFAASIGLSYFREHHHKNRLINKLDLSPSKDTISCPNLGNGWKKEGSIYCINPSLPAKPNGLKNLAVLQSKGDRNIVNIAMN